MEEKSEQPNADQREAEPSAGPRKAEDTAADSADALSGSPSDPLGDAETSVSSRSDGAQDASGKQTRSRHLSVDAPVSSVVHLLGVAKASDLDHLHSKIDLLLTRQEADHKKLNDLAAAIATSSQSAATERVSMHLTQSLALLRQLAKKLGVE